MIKPVKPRSMKAVVTQTENVIIAAAHTTSAATGYTLTPEMATAIAALTAAAEGLTAAAERLIAQSSQSQQQQQQQLMFVQQEQSRLQQQHMYMIQQQQQQRCISSGVEPVNSLVYIALTLRPMQSCVALLKQRRHELCCCWPLSSCCFDQTAAL
jgi:hypothetical protein